MTEASLAPTRTTPVRTAAVLLAAGHSRRWGADDKLLAPWNGRPLVSYAATLLCRVPVDLRAAVVHDPQVGAQIDQATLLSPDGDDQAGSLRAAVAWAGQVGASRLLVLLGDMPFVTEGLAVTILDDCTDDTPSAARHPDGRPGAPACFPESLFPALSSLHGDRGAGELLQDATCVSAPAAELVDVDVPQDLSAG